MKRGENEKWISMSMEEFPHNMSNKRTYRRPEDYKKKKEKVKKKFEHKNYLLTTSA